MIIHIVVKVVIQDLVTLVANTIYIYSLLIHLFKIRDGFKSEFRKELALNSIDYFSPSSPKWTRSAW